LTFDDDDDDDDVDDDWVSGGGSSSSSDGCGVDTEVNKATTTTTLLTCSCKACAYFCFSMACLILSSGSTYMDSRPPKERRPVGEMVVAPGSSSRGDIQGGVDFVGGGGGSSSISDVILH